MFTLATRGSAFILCFYCVRTPRRQPILPALGEPCDDALYPSTPDEENLCDQLVCKFPIPGEIFVHLFTYVCGG